MPFCEIKNFFPKLSDTMRHSAALLLCGLFLTASASADEAGWTSLFDGKTLAGWKGYTGKPIGSQWMVEDGAIHLAAGGGGDIVTAKEFRSDLKIRELKPE